MPLRNDIMAATRGKDTVVEERVSISNDLRHNPGEGLRLTGVVLMPCIQPT